jgi:hypothetical protein
MWTSVRRDLPWLDEQVVGLAADGCLGWWTRTTDGWYVSEKRGQIGHRDAMTVARSRGPEWWTVAPTQPEPVSE